MLAPCPRRRDEWLWALKGREGVEWLVCMPSPMPDPPELLWPRSMFEEETWPRPSVFAQGLACRRRQTLRNWQLPCVPALRQLWQPVESPGSPLQRIFLLRHLPHYNKPVSCRAIMQKIGGTNGNRDPAAGALVIAGAGGALHRDWMGSRIVDGPVVLLAGHGIGPAMLLLLAGKLVGTGARVGTCRIGWGAGAVGNYLAQRPRRAWVAIVAGIVAGVVVADHVASHVGTKVVRSSG